MTQIYFILRPRIGPPHTLLIWGSENGPRSESHCSLLGAKTIMPPCISCVSHVLDSLLSTFAKCRRNGSIVLILDSLSPCIGFIFFPLVGYQIEYHAKLKTFGLSWIAVLVITDSSLGCCKLGDSSPKDQEWDFLELLILLCPFFAPSFSFIRRHIFVIEADLEASKRQGLLCGGAIFNRTPSISLRH